MKCHRFGDDAGRVSIQILLAPSAQNPEARGVDWIIVDPIRIIVDSPYDPLGVGHLGLVFPGSSRSLDAEFVRAVPRWQW